MGRAEASVEDYLVKRVKETGGHIRKCKWLGRDGAPDRLVWWRFPVCAFVETKSPTGWLEHSQKREFKRLQDTGWPVFTVHTKEAVDSFIQIMLARGADLL
jgi:hypothetical protein